jgi:hypothetical protein
VVVSSRLAALTSFNLGPSPPETCKIIVDRATGEVCARPSDLARGTRNMCPGREWGVGGLTADVARFQAEAWGVAHHD